MAKEKPKQIDVNEWIYKGCFIQKSEHPQLKGKYEVFKNNEEETQITSMYEVASNPFKIGDEISLNVEELYPVDYNKFKEDYQIKMINDNKELEAKFKRKKVKLVREGKYVNFKVAKEAKLTIEYHCVYSED